MLDSETFMSFPVTFGQEDPIEVAERLLAAIKKASDARQAKLFFLDLTSGDYYEYSAQPDSSPLDLMGISRSSSTLPEVKNTINRGQPIINGPCLFLPVMRNSICLAILELQYEREIHNQDLSRFHWLSVYASAFRFVYIFRFAHTLLENLKEPLPFEGIDEDTYYKSLVSTLALSSGIERIALRELKENGDLTCLAISGFSSTTSPQEFSFPATKIPSVFRVAIDNQLHYRSDAQNISELQDNPIYADVRSFAVLPILVGEGIFGTLSFAVPISYEFSNFEISALEAIANGTGVAITNFHSSKDKERQLDSLGDLALSMSAVDVSQAVRHESIGYIDRAQSRIAALLRKPKSTITDLGSDIQQLSGTIDLIKQSVNKIKLATEPPEREFSTEGIKDIWDVTCKLLEGGRLGPAGITAHFQGENVRIKMYPDWIRTAFFNLLLNSYDAYQKRSGGGDKGVLLKVADLSNDRLVLEYTDHAGGININKLKLPKRYKNKKEINMNEILFHPGVTSKGKEGNGYGLYLARKGIQVHQPFGSLNLLAAKGGIKFQITLPMQISP